MESFSKKIKNEIMCLPIKSPIGVMHELHSIVLFSNHNITKDKTIELFINNDILINHISDLVSFLSNCAKLFGYKYKLEIINHRNKKKYLFGVSLPVKELDNLNIGNENIPYFLRGMFLSCASIVNPALEYRIEFHTKSKELCHKTIRLLNSLKDINLNPKYIERKNGNVIYISDGEKIIDFLTFIGAKNCAMDLIQVRMVKEVRNKINRSTNFETANISKTTTSAAKQLNTIKKIIKLNGLEFLPEKLRQVALLRLNNPYSSLSELAEISGNTLTKSGIHHRLKRIMTLSSNKMSKK